MVYRAFNSKHSVFNILYKWRECKRYDQVCAYSVNVFNGIIGSVWRQCFKIAYVKLVLTKLTYIERDKMRNGL